MEIQQTTVNANKFHFRLIIAENNFIYISEQDALNIKHLETFA